MLGNWNDIYVGKQKYRWRHSHDGRGTAVLVSVSDMGSWYGEEREGKLRLERGEWVFTRGAFTPPWSTGTGVMREAKQIVQVRLAMEAANDN